tara:strand:- start:1555 stop:2451 length:897 start_codon:yes stop_codon:yes gene_type:complete
MLNKIVIIGCGLIGCSIAGAVKKNKTAKEIVGIEANKNQLVVKTGYFDSVKKNILEVDNADLVIICTPVSSLKIIFKDLITQIYQGKFSLITDVFSTKKSLLKIVSGLEPSLREVFIKKYISCHPIAGSEKSGPIWANPMMFQNSKVLICPFDCADQLTLVQKQKEKNGKSITDFWKSIGGITKFLPISEHDRFFAHISHFPHLISFSIAIGLSRSFASSNALSINGGGLRDTTRIAGAPPDLWTDIIFDNKDEILKLVHHWNESWKELIKTLDVDDKDKFKKLLIEASEWRNRFDGN